MRNRISRSLGLVVALLFVVAVGAITARTTVAADPVAPAPELYVYDAPFVRTTTVELAFVRLGGYGGNITEFRASNDPTVSAGVLVNGVAVTEVSQWALAPGPDGPRTIYGQIHYSSGLWSAVASISLVLDTSPGNAMAVDLDPVPNLGSVPPDADWHQVFRGPATPFVGVTTPPGVPHGFHIMAGGWSVSYWQPDGTITAGTHVIPEPIGDDASQTSAAVGNVNGTCHGAGTFDIHEITFTAGGDIASVSADFRLTCWTTVVASGSIRYGSADPIVFLDQSIDYATFAETPIGEATTAQVATFTNDGDAATTLGETFVDGTNPGDFEITADTCAEQTLSVGESCSVSVRARPGGMGQRTAFLRIPDSTPHEGREVWLSVYGLQQTTVTIDPQVLPAFGPNVARIVVTSTPDGAPVRFFVTGVESYQVVEQQHLTGPSRAVVTYEVTLPPGPHDITASVPAEGGYVASQATPVHVVVGTATSLTLSTVTDDGVAVGESVDLIAKLQAGAALPGGTLRIRDGVTNAILASKTASGTSDSLTLTVTRGLGTHPYTAQYVPPASDIQAAAAAYDLTVVTGSRPDTTMETTTLVTSFGEVHSAFGSPDSGVSFECRVNLSDWFDCTSPSLFRTNQFGANTISVRAIRPNGLADRTPSVRPWILDWTGPTATAPTRTTPAGRSLLSQGRVSIHLAWSAADTESAVASYDVEVQTDGRTYWERIASGTSATGIDAWFYPNHAYRVRVRGTNAAGITGEWTAGSAWKQLAYQEWSSAVKYTGPWARVRSVGYLNEVANASSTAGAKATFTYTGTSISLISRLGPTRGRAAIYVDGVYVQTIDLYDKAYKNQRVVWSKTWSTRAKHTVTVKVMGTSGRPRVEIDGFVVGS